MKKILYVLSTLMLLAIIFTGCTNFFESEVRIEFISTCPGINTHGATTWKQVNLGEKLPSYTALLKENPNFKAPKGYEFAGWSTQEAPAELKDDKRKAEYVNEAVFTKNTHVKYTLYTVWKINEKFKNYKIIFHPSETNKTLKVEQPIGDALTEGLKPFYNNKGAKTEEFKDFLAPTGYNKAHFVGWWTQHAIAKKNSDIDYADKQAFTLNVEGHVNDNKIKSESEGKILDEKNKVVNLYAAWGVYIVFDLNTAKMGTTTAKQPDNGQLLVYKDQEAKLPILTSYNKQDKEFIGWAFDKNATSAVFKYKDSKIQTNLTFNNHKTHIAGDKITLYAIWK